jgi:metal-responsive CopG/Arc/MetJ family transcriptional regulator
MEKDKKSSEFARFNISMKNSLFERVEKYADDLGLNRSAFIALCCSQYINAQEGMIQIKSLVGIMNELKDKEKLSDDDIKQIDEMGAVINALSNGLK